MPKQLGTLTLPQLAGLPGSGVAGQVHFNLTDLKTYVHDGTTWNALGATASRAFPFFIS